MKKRILVLLTMALVMAAMLVATAAPALPQLPPNCEQGQSQAASNAEERQDFAQVQKHDENRSDCMSGLPPGEGHDK